MTSQGKYVEEKQTWKTHAAWEGEHNKANDYLES